MRRVLAALVSVMALWTTSVRATALTFELDFEFSGGVQPSGPAPWVKVTIDDALDSIGANGVRVTIEAVGLSGNEFIDELLLNLNPALDPTALAMTAVDVSDVAPGSVGFSSGVDFEQADGDGKFDMEFDFPSSNSGGGVRRFKAGEEIVVDLSYSGPLSASDFGFLSAPGGGNGSYYAAAHVQATGPSSEDSGWIGPRAPEPATVCLLGAGLAGVALAARRRSGRR